MDAEGEPVLVDGRYETRYRYDRRRRLSEEVYYDLTGEMMNRTDSFYALRKIIRDGSGAQIGERYYDAEGKLTMSSDGYAGYELRKDTDGNEFKVYFDSEGKEIEIKHESGNMSGIDYNNTDLKGITANCG